ncbi:hypothetical protein BDR26DRAFT_863768 [Obelidium mucronatum]|nr:hypothetical protein BDR26DRAFT_863768 [Obelidium mucronatum]
MASSPTATTTTEIPTDLELFFLEIEAELDAPRKRRELQHRHDQIVAEMRTELLRHPIKRVNQKQHLRKLPNTTNRLSNAGSSGTLCANGLEAPPTARTSPWISSTLGTTLGIEHGNPCNDSRVSCRPFTSSLHVEACRQQIQKILATQARKE